MWHAAPSATGRPSSRWRRSASRSGRCRRSSCPGIPDTAGRRASFRTRYNFPPCCRTLRARPGSARSAAVLSGYLGDAAQAEADRLAGRGGAGQEPAMRSMSAIRSWATSAGSTWLKPVAEALRDVLLPLADIATPNRYELEWMAGATLDDHPLGHGRRRTTAGPPTMLVTSAPAMMTGGTGNRAADADRGAACRASPDRAAAQRPRRPHRSGVPGPHPRRPAGRQGAAIDHRVGVRDLGAHGQARRRRAALETDAASLSHPMAMVHLRHLTHPGRDRRA